MTFKEVLAQVLAWLQQEQRVSYRALKRQFALDDAYLEDLKDALLYAHPQVVEDQGRGLRWTGDAAATPAVSPAASASYPDRSLKPNAASSPCCSVTWSTRPRLASQLDPEELARWCAPIKRPAPR